MTTLTDQLGLLEAERDRIKAENESLRTRLAKQAGAHDENRGQNKQLLAQIERLAGRVAYLEKHFYDFHGSAEQIERQRKDIAEQANPGATVAEAVHAPETPMRSLMRRLVASEAPMNGAAA